MSKCLLISIFIWHTSAFAINCAISTEYPPYQYVKDGLPQGIDPQLIELFNKTSDEEIKITPMPWKTALAKLYYTDEFDCVWGMEVSPKRQAHFLLSRPLYKRRSTFFALSESPVKSFEDLKDKVIIGDKSSELERELREANIAGLRIRNTLSKEKSYKMLIKKEVFGVILPYAVGEYLSKTNGNSIKDAFHAKVDTPVVVAVKKGNLKLLELIEAGIEKIPEDAGKKILEPWQFATPSPSAKAK